MAKPKWIQFGTPQPLQATENAKPAPPPPPAACPADAKKFGLENFGNTCYANSVLQALYFCTPFRELLLQTTDPAGLDLLPPPAIPPVPAPPPAPRRKQSVSGQPPDGLPAGASSQASVASIPPSPPTLFSALRSLFLYISTNPADKGTVAPRAFIDKLKEVNELFRSNLHQDAHEFLNYLLNKIVEEMEEEKRQQQNGTPPAEDLSSSIATLASRTPPTIVTATSSNSGTSPQDATLVHKLFEGVLTSETRCLTCETVSSRDESFLDLSIDIEQNSSVTACLRQFSASEMLCQKNKFFCDSCCDLQEAEKRMKIKKLPNILALHLKRFKYQEDVQKYIKLAYRVAFPFELRLFNTVDDTDDADRLYELFSIVIHIGNGPHHGHYVSIVKTMGTWVMFDDDNVGTIKESEIPKYFGENNAGSAYVLYYQAVDIDLVSLGLRRPPVPGSVPSLQSMRPSISPTHSTPVLPPGLEEGDVSDISDPPFPVTPSRSSPPAVYVERETPSRKPSVPVLSVSTTRLDGPSVPVVSPTATTPTISRGGLFRRGSMQTRVGGADGTPDRVYPAAKMRPATSAGGDQPTIDAAVLPAVPSPVLGPAMPPISNGKEVEKPERAEKVRKEPSWFKRKSFRIGEKREGSSSTLSSPVLPAASVGENGDTAGSSAWFRSTAHPPKKKARRPSEAGLADGGGLHSFTVVRPHSTAGLPLKVNGYESPPPGSVSSVGSTSVTHSSEAPATTTPKAKIEIPVRSASYGPSAGLLAGSLAPLTPTRALPEHKKSLSSLAHREAQARVPPRPATAGASTMRASTRSTLPVPPVPAVPPPVGPRSPARPMTANGHVVAASEGMARGGSRDGGSTEDDDAFEQRTSSTHSVALAGAGSSGAGAGAGGIKRATRKLSFSAPMLGFGKRDRDRERAKEKAPPVSFVQQGMTPRI